MVKTNETFFQVVPPVQPGTVITPPPDVNPAAKRTAQATVP
jgi:hypothetical protein